MNPFLAIPFFIALLIIIACIIVAFVSDNDDKQFAACMIGIFTLVITVCLGEECIKSWNAQHPPPQPITLEAK